MRPTGSHSGTATARFGCCVTIGSDVRHSSSALSPARTSRDFPRTRRRRSRSRSGCGSGVPPVSPSAGSATTCPGGSTTPSVRAPEELVTRARDLLASLEVGRGTLIHGDFHHHNILDAGGRYVAIDPKPMLGEPEYDVPSFLWNPYLSRMRLDVTERRIEAFVAAGLDEAADPSLDGDQGRLSPRGRRRRGCRRARARTGALRRAWPQETKRRSARRHGRRLFGLDPAGYAAGRPGLSGPALRPPRRALRARPGHRDPRGRAWCGPGDGRAPRSRCLPLHRGRGGPRDGPIPRRAVRRRDRDRQRAVRGGRDRAGVDRSRRQCDRLALDRPGARSREDRSCREARWVVGDVVDHVPRSRRAE